MEYEYDSETDILIIKLSKEKPDFGEQQGNIIAHYNKENKPVQIEILDASSTVMGLIGTILKERRNSSLTSA